mgnify:CR=1 FL=1
MTATDTDCGTNSIISFSLSAPGVVAPDEFEINADTGVIRLSKALDFETKPIHEFPVTVTDQGTSPPRPCPVLDTAFVSPSLSHRGRFRCCGERLTMMFRPLPTLVAAIFQ